MAELTSWLMTRACVANRCPLRVAHIENLAWLEAKVGLNFATLR